MAGPRSPSPFPAGHRSPAGIAGPAPHRVTVGAGGTVVVLCTVLTLLLPAGLAAQPDEPQFRVGISLGGVSTLGLVLEQVWDWGSMELMLGTWSFRDVSVSLVHKQRIGGGDVYGVAGLGVWAVVAFPADERTGLAVVGRVPVGVEWDAGDRHFLSMEVGLNRALWVRRTDPEDFTPMNRRIVPLPNASWRWAPN